MKITEDTKVSEVLDRYPRLLEVLAAYHPHFERLRNKVLRKVMAPRVNLEQAARMAKVDLRALLATLNRAIGEEPEEVAGVSSKKASPRPPELQGLREESMVAIYKGEEGVSKAEGARAPSREGLRPQEGLVTLDVRGLSPPEPMMKVLEALTMLREGQTLIVEHHRRPMFLYAKLDERGYEHVTEEEGPDYFRITIWKKRP